MNPLRWHLARRYRCALIIWALFYAHILPLTSSLPDTAGALPTAAAPAPAPATESATSTATATPTATGTAKEAATPTATPPAAETAATAAAAVRAKKSAAAAVAASTEAEAEVCSGYTAEKAQELLGKALLLREELRRAHEFIGEGELLADEIAVPARTGGDLIRPLPSPPPNCTGLPKSRLLPGNLASFASVPEPLLWHPVKAKYLLVNCRKNQASNRRRCYQNHLLLAGMLNRTLVVHYRRSEVVRLYNPRLLLPLAQLRRCYGLHAILTTGEARRRSGGERLAVEAVVCTVGNGTCIHEPGRFLDGFPPLSEDVSFPPTLQNTVLGLPIGGHTNLVEVAAKVQQVAKDMGVIVVNDMGGQNLALPWGHQLSGDLPFRRRRGCPNALAPPPHPAAFEAARRFLQASGFQGQAFAGVHWRRGDFLKLSLADGALTRLSPQQAGECVAQKMASGALTRVFLASNGNASELAAFKGELESRISGVQVFSLPSNWTGEPWAQPLWTAHKFSRTEDAEQLGADIDKVVCALGSLFLGTQFSSFSGFIEHMRVALRRASCADDLICASLQQADT